MEEEENSSLIIINGSNSPSPFSTPNSLPSSPSKSPEDLINDIDNLSTEISSYTEKNANARFKCKELERDIEEITNELSKLIDEAEQNFQTLEAENDQIQIQIDYQENLKQQLVDYYIELASRGINLKQFQDVDYDLLVFLAGREISIEFDDLDSKIQRIILAKRFFQNCYTNEDFIERCSGLVNGSQDPSEYEKTKADEIDYEKLMEELQRHHDETNEKVADEIKVLARKRDELLDQIKNIESSIENEAIQKNSHPTKPINEDDEKQPNSPPETNKSTTKTENNKKTEKSPPIKSISVDINKPLKSSSKIKKNSSKKDENEIIEKSPPIKVNDGNESKKRKTSPKIHENSSKTEIKEKPPSTKSNNSAGSIKRKSSPKIQKKPSKSEIREVPSSIKSNHIDINKQRRSLSPIKSNNKDISKPQKSSPSIKSNNNDISKPRKSSPSIKSNNNDISKPRKSLSPIKSNNNDINKQRKSLSPIKSNNNDINKQRKSLSPIKSNNNDISKPRKSSPSIKSNNNDISDIGKPRKSSPKIQKDQPKEETKERSPLIKSNLSVGSAQRKSSPKNEENSSKTEIREIREIIEKSQSISINELKTKISNFKYKYRPKKVTLKKPKREPQTVRREIDEESIPLQLISVDVSYSTVSSLKFLNRLQRVQSVNASDTFISDFSGAPLRLTLRNIKFRGSPIARNANYRIMALVMLCMEIEYIDNQKVTKKERNLATSLKLKIQPKLYDGFVLTSTDPVTLIKDDETIILSEEKAKQSKVKNHEQIKMDQTVEMMEKLKSEIKKASSDFGVDSRSNLTIRKLLNQNKINRKSSFVNEHSQSIKYQIISEEETNEKSKDKQNTDWVLGENIEK